MHFINFAYSDIYRTSLLPLSSLPFSFPSHPHHLPSLSSPFLTSPSLTSLSSHSFPFPSTSLPFLPFHSLSSHSLQFILYQPAIYLLLSGACFCLIFYFYLLPSSLYFRLISGIICLCFLLSLSAHIFSSFLSLIVNTTA